jgi:hypothetical protein
MGQCLYKQAGRRSKRISIIKKNPSLYSFNI